MSDRILQPTDNVFRDLGFSEAEAENLRVRSVLMGHVRSIIDQEGLTQTRAATLFGVTQPRISTVRKLAAGLGVKPERLVVRNQSETLPQR